MPFCPKCGKKVSEEAIFCPTCGAAISVSKTSRVKPKSKIRKKDNLLIVIALTSIILVVFASVAWILFSPLFFPLGTYRAEDTKSYSGMVTVDRVYVEVDNFNGPILVSTWEKAEYKIDLKINARGSSPENAEDNLNALKISFFESTIQGHKSLTLKYDVPFLTHSRYSIEVNVVLPENTVIDLDLESSNEGIYLTQIKGRILKLITSNGPIIFNDVNAEIISGGTSNGKINGKLEAKDLSLSTSNSGIDLFFPCTINAKYDLKTSNEAMVLTVSPSSQVGYDLDLSTSNGVIDINLSNLNYIQNQKTRKEAISDGFNDKIVQITIQASTSNGNIDVDTFGDFV